MSNFDPNINFDKSRSPTPPPGPKLNPQDPQIHEVALNILHKPVEKNSFEISNVSSQDTLNSFEHITRYLPQCKELLQQAEGREKEIEELCNNLKAGNWASILEKGNLSTLPTDALRAFHDQKITGQQFSTVMIYWAAFSELPPSDILIQPLFNEDGTESRDAHSWIRSTLPAELRQKRDVDSLLDQFFDKMKNKPKSEQTFLYIPHDSYTEAKQQLAEKITQEEAKNSSKTQEELLAKYDQTISDAIASTGFTFLSRFEDYDHRLVLYIMMPTFGMMQAFVEAYGEEKAVQITPVIGLSTREDIRKNGLEGTRDMALPFPGVELPKEADTLSAPFAIDFIFHDFYHSIVASAIPEKWRKAFIEYSDALLEIIEEESDNNIKTFLEEYYERIIDMEYGMFGDPVSSASEAERFFISVDYQQKNALLRIFPVNRHQDTINPYNGMEREITIATELYRVGVDGVMSKLAKKLDEKGFCSRHNISISDLKNREYEVEQEIRNDLGPFEGLRKEDGKYRCTDEELQGFPSPFQKKVTIKGEDVSVMGAFLGSFEEHKKRDIGVQLYKLSQK